MPKIIFRSSVNARITSVKCSVDGVQCFTIQQKLKQGAPADGGGWNYFGAYRGDHLISRDTTVPLSQAKDAIRKFIAARAPVTDIK